MGPRFSCTRTSRTRGIHGREALANEGAARGIGTEVRVRVGAVDERHQRAVAMGYVSIQRPHDDGTGRTCQIMGPDGYFFTLWEPQIGGS